MVIETKLEDVYKSMPFWMRKLYKIMISSAWGLGWRLSHNPTLMKDWVYNILLLWKYDYPYLHHSCLLYLLSRHFPHSYQPCSLGSQISSWSACCPRHCPSHCSHHTQQRSSQTPSHRPMNKLWAIAEGIIVVVLKGTYQWLGDGHSECWDKERLK